MQAVEPRLFRKACQARDLAAAFYLFNPRVTLIDVGWRIEESQGGQISQDLAVRVHVHRKPRGPVLEAFAERHPGLMIDKNRIAFPVDIVEASYPLQWYWDPVQPPPRGRIFTVLQGGISISNEWLYNYGTLGGLVEDRETGEKMILGNWHVLAGSAYAPRGLGIYQPGRADGGSFQHTIAYLERHAMNQGLDAAVAKLTGARSTINNQLDVGRVSGETLPTLGMKVVKSGRGSSVTRGMIDGVEGEYPIRYGGLPRKIKHVHRVVPLTSTDEASRGGDSGSWWLEQDTRKAAALHFAGFDSPETALAMAMPPVLDALNVNIVTEVEPVGVTPVPGMEPIRI